MRHILFLVLFLAFGLSAEAGPTGAILTKRKAETHKKEVKQWEKAGKPGPKPAPPGPIAVNKNAVESFGSMIAAAGKGVNAAANVIKEKVVVPFVEKVATPVIKNTITPVVNATMLPIVKALEPVTSFVAKNVIEPINDKVIQPAVGAVNNGLQKLADSDNPFFKVVGKVGQTGMVGLTALAEVSTSPARLSIEAGKNAVKTVKALGAGDVSGALLGMVQAKSDQMGISRVTDMGKTWETSKTKVDKVVPGMGTIGGMVIESIPVVGDAVSAAGSAYKIEDALKKGKYDEALGEAGMAGFGLVGKGAGRAANGVSHIATSAIARGAVGVGGSRTLANAAKAATKVEPTAFATMASKLSGKSDSLAKLATRADDALVNIAKKEGAQDVAFANKMLNKLDVTKVEDAQKLATKLKRVEKATDLVDKQQKVGEIKQAIDYATGAASPDDDDDDSNKPDNDKKDDKKDDKSAAGDPNANRAIALAPVNNNGGAAQAAPVNSNPVIAPGISNSSNMLASKAFNSFRARKTHPQATLNRISPSVLKAVLTPVVANGVIAPAPAPKPLAQAAPLPPQNSGGGRPNTPAPAAPAPGAHVAGGFEYIFQFFNDDDDDDTIHISSATLTGLNQNDVDITGNPNDASVGPMLVPKGTHGVTVKGAHYGVTSPNDIKGTMRVLPGGGGAAVRSGGDQKFHLFIRDTRNPHDTQTLHVHAK